MNHINGVRNDNRVSNLEWVTPSENRIRRTKPAPKLINAKKIIQKDTTTGETVKVWDSVKTLKSALHIGRREGVHHGFQWEDEKPLEIEGEQWKKVTVDDKREIDVSDHGRVKLNSGKITYGSLSTTGYLCMSFKYKQFYVHRLVCLAFNPTENPELVVVDHKDGNKFNNKAENLEFVTIAENVQRGRTAGCLATQPVCQFTLEKELVAIFPSAAAAGRFIDGNAGNMCRICCGGRKTYERKGFLWRYRKDCEVDGKIVYPTQEEKPSIPPASPSSSPVRFRLIKRG